MLRGSWERLPIKALLRSMLVLTLVAVGIAVQTAPTVRAQATRTWVSGVGDDVNPCSRTAPCKTFAGAVSKTAAGGEINCLDPGGFGTVTLTKSMTIDCTGTFGSVLASGGINGINVNDGSTGTPGTIIVALRGISINGGAAPPAAAGSIGINFSAGEALTVENSFIFGFNSGNGRGIFVPGMGGGQFVQLAVNNTVITNNGVGIPGGGAIVLGNVPPAAPTGGVIRAMISDTKMLRNNIGLRVSPNTEATMKSSILSTNISFNMTAFSAAAGNPAFINVDDCVFAESIGGEGIHSEGPGSIVRVARSIISGNNIGLSASNSAQLLTAGNNFNQGNITSNGVFSGNAPLS